VSGGDSVRRSESRWLPTSVDPAVGPQPRLGRAVVVSVRFRRLIVLVAVIVGAARTPSAALALVAPGRVTVPFAAGKREGVDPFSVAGAAVMPDGRIVTTGVDAGPRRLLLTRALSSGAPDASFGGDGVVSLDVPRDPAMYGPFPGGPQLADDGSIYVASRGPGRARYEGQQLVVTHVLADGSPDPAFGVDGSAMPGVQGGPMALTGDGRILVAGHIGQIGRASCRERV